MDAPAPGKLTATLRRGRALLTHVDVKHNSFLTVQPSAKIFIHRDGSAVVHIINGSEYYCMGAASAREAWLTASHLVRYHAYLIDHADEAYVRAKAKVRGAASLFDLFNEDDLPF